MSICRAFHKLHEIFHKLSRNFKKTCSKFAHKNKQKLLFVTKVAQKLLEKYKDVLWSDAKIPGGGGRYFLIRDLGCVAFLPIPYPLPLSTPATQAIRD